LISLCAPAAPVAEPALFVEGLKAGQLFDGAAVWQMLDGIKEFVSNGGRLVNSP
jgi:hypothetical protein